MLLEVENLTSTYGQIRALKGVSLHVERGEIVALVGANGAGKTTLLNSISGLHAEKKGTIRFDGQRIDGMNPTDTVRLGLVHVPEHRQLFGTMTVYDNIVLGAYHRRRSMSKADLEADLQRVYQVFPILQERTKQLAGTLSGGEQQMLAIGRGIMSAPKLILLDEPSLGLAPLIVKSLFEVIRQLRDEGVTIVLVEQNAKAALRLADRAYALETGQVVLEGPAEDLLADDRVAATYLGGH
jgi:branched-chain amino acid transport system ATP-binding protein